MRVCFFGDSFTTGVGDRDGLGWRGRLVVGALGAGLDLTAYDLGIRRDTSADIRRRWRQEAAARLPAGYAHRLAFSFGANDAADDGAGGPRIALTETVANARAILSGAARLAPTIMIGPAPILDDAKADARIAVLEAALADVARQEAVPFLPVLTFAQRSAAWSDSAAAGDGAHPDGAGYAEMAHHISGWAPYRQWVGLPPDLT